MSDEFSGIEGLLGLPQGSTRDISPDEAGELLVKGVADKTKELSKGIKKVDALENMSSADLVKCGLSVESLEQDKFTIRNELFEVYRIGKALLTKYSDDVKDLVDVNDRMYTAGAKILDSVSGSLDRLGNMIMKFKQEEEMRQLTVEGDDEDGRKEMSPDQWMDFVDASKDTKQLPDDNVKDAEIIEPENKEE